MFSKLKRNSFVKYTIAFLLLFFLAAISELIFICKNQPGKLAIITLSVAKTVFLKECSETGIDLINISSYLHSIEEGKHHDGAPIFYYDKKEIVETGINNQVICELITKDNRIFSKNSADLLSQLYYRISLLIYQSNNKDLTISMLSNSISLSPALSFYYIELADLYLEQNEESKAIEVFDKCKGYSPSRIHCQEYENEYNESKNYRNFGYYEREIDDFITQEVDI